MKKKQEDEELPATVTGELSSLDWTWPSVLEIELPCTLWQRAQAICTALTATSTSLEYFSDSEGVLSSFVWSSIIEEEERQHKQLWLNFDRETRLCFDDELWRCEKDKVPTRWDIRWLLIILPFTKTCGTLVARPEQYKGIDNISLSLSLSLSQITYDLTWIMCVYCDVGRESENWKDQKTVVEVKGKFERIIKKRMFSFMISTKREAIPVVIRA